MNHRDRVIERQEEAALIVSARSMLCALPLSVVRETHRPLPVEPLAGAPTAVRGAAMLRGELVPVLDLGLLLGVPDMVTTRFVTLRIEARCVALAVASVLGVRSLDASTRQTLPPLLRDTASGAVTSVGVHDHQLLAVLQASLLVPENTWEALEARR